MSTPYASDPATSYTDLYAQQYGYPAPVADEDDGSGRHPVHLAHLVWGVVFAAFLGIWALVATDTVPTDDLRWLLPVPWLLAGTAGILAAFLGRGRSRRRGRDAYPPAGVASSGAGARTDLDDLLDSEVPAQTFEREGGVVGGDAVDPGSEERRNL